MCQLLADTAEHDLPLDSRESLLARFFNHHQRLIALSPVTADRVGDLPAWATDWVAQQPGFAAGGYDASDKDDASMGDPTPEPSSTQLRRSVRLSRKPDPATMFGSLQPKSIAMHGRKGPRGGKK